MAQWTASSGRKMPSAPCSAGVAVERHLEDLHHRRDHADEDDEAQEGEIDIGQPGPGPGALGEQQRLDEIVGRDGDGLDDDQRHPDADGGLEPLRHGKEGAHAEKEDEREVLLEDRALEEVDHRGSPPSPVRRRNSGSSTCSGFQVRIAQMRKPMMKKALGASSISPSGWNQPPASTVASTG